MSGSSRSSTMRLRTSESSFRLNFALVKFSGYIFYSVEKVGKKLIAKRSLLDILIFCVSLSFHFIVYNKTRSRDFNKNLSSTNLAEGVGILYNSFILSQLFTKCFNFFTQISSFKIVKAFYWIEKKVKLFSCKTLKIEMFDFFR